VMRALRYALAVALLPYIAISLVLLIGGLF
jgi:hypothetical protein